MVQTSKGEEGLTVSQAFGASNAFIRSTCTFAWWMILRWRLLQLGIEKHSARGPVKGSLKACMIFPKAYSEKADRAGVLKTERIYGKREFAIGEWKYSCWSSHFFRHKPPAYPTSWRLDPITL